MWDKGKWAARFTLAHWFTVCSAHGDCCDRLTRKTLVSTLWTNSLFCTKSLENILSLYRSSVSITVSNFCSGSAFPAWLRVMVNQFYLISLVTTMHGRIELFGSLNLSGLDVCVAMVQVEVLRDQRDQRRLEAI